MFDYLEREYGEGLEISIMRDKGLLEFPIGKRWLKGEEYGFLLRHFKTYRALKGYNVNEDKQDPMVYAKPESMASFFFTNFI